MKTQLIEIKRNALDDGPGIRSVVFFKGCALDCIWCHNPESKSCVAELSFDAQQCIGCGECVRVCEPRALRVGNPIRLNRKNCSHCFACVTVCPSKALTRVGENINTATLLARLRADYPFFHASNGGVTLSGGEPTLQVNVLAELLPVLKAEGVHVLLQTSGFYTPRTFDRFIYPFLDSIYFDLKVHDRNRHREACGQDNQRVLANLKTLRQREQEGGVELLPRLALVPGITDTADNLSAWASVLNMLDIRRIQLLRYNPLWPQKISRLGHDKRIPGELTQWAQAEVLQHAKNIFQLAGITTI